MRVVATHTELQSLAPAGCVFVPTMGALHAGHGSLVTTAASLRAAEYAKLPVLVSIFVNPTQFNDKSDLARYPRTMEADVKLCTACGADIVFAPSVQEVYPPGKSVEVPPLPAVAVEPKLEDAFRPGHFAGVCQVVARLFDLARPAAALFGEKDWQQLKVIESMAQQTPSQQAIRVIGVPTIRESDGLAMSSRNIFLSSDDRRKALAISRAIRDVSACRIPRDAEQFMHQSLTAAGLQVEYATVREARTLLHPPEQSGEPPESWNGRALIAARVGSVRLIDNAEWR